ncbi:MAG: N-acetyltransferase [Alphaproteobacteria bacterium]|nr:N-acetyltransferase [Alphaproteobacteria bacterium]
MIRAFKPEDLEEIMKIWLETNLKAHHFVDSDYWKNNFNFVKMVMPQSEVYVAEENGKIVGFIGLVEGYIAGLFVDEKHQRKGIGKALLREAQKRYNLLTLNVYVRNNDAVRFYLKHEFELVTKQTNPDTGEEECEMNWERKACMMGGSC